MADKCVYCKEPVGKDIINHVYSGLFNDVVFACKIMDKELYLIGCPQGAGTNIIPHSKIKYCPMCGRKL
jgi:hypothetical protein